MEEKEKAMQIISAVSMALIMADKMRPVTENEKRYWEQWEKENNWPND